MSEFDLIAKLAQRIGPPGSKLEVGVGDDAAVATPGGATATSVDAIVEGVHFSRDTSPLPAIGRKALAAALSDLAAMGAEAGEAYIVLGVPPDLDEAGCLAVHDGIVALAADTGTALAGGDVTRSPVLFLSITVVGHAAAPESLVLRSGAKPGDALAVTGAFGGAAAGLLLLEADVIPSEARDLAAGLAPEVAEQLKARQLHATPRLEAGRALADAGATAMIDISDGVFADAALLAAASKVGVEIDSTLLPVAEGVADVARAAGVDELGVVGGGEDYELLVTLPDDRFEEAAQATETSGVELTRIGSVLKGEGITLQGPDGKLEPPPGHDHLA